MATDLVPHTTSGNGSALSTDSWRDLTDLAGKLSRSGLIPGALRGKPDDVLVVLLSGRELGIAPMLALRSIHVIDGKPVLSADLAAALVLRSPVCKEFRCAEASETRAVYKAQRANESEASTYEFTMEDAKRAGLATRQNWRNFPKAMLRARCCMMAARAHFPDLVASVYEPDELPAQPAAVVEQPRTLAEFKAQAKAIADTTPAPSESGLAPSAIEAKTESTAVEVDRAEAKAEVGPDGPEPPMGALETDVAETPAALATRLVLSLGRVEAKKHLANWRKAHAAEINSLKEQSPADYERVVAAGKAAAERVA